ncbi:MAG TPA: nuclear transport factor 2 family protein [Solirubrobacteraceae bacterium]|nr:nuclear transport factor 2 family protein [Solirubrobacteraceae bacterium]
MDDAVTRYCAASQAGDMDGLASTLAADVQLPSPLFGRMTFKGRADVHALLTIVYGILRDVRWEEPIGEGRARVAVTHASIAGLRIGDAMVFELDQDGLIRSIRPHLRPLLATSVFALMVGPRAARRPGLVLRALRGGL